MSATPLPRDTMAISAAGPRWEAECGGKDPYPSEAAANAALIHIKRCGNARKACWLDSYECSFCRQWHLGNIGSKR